MLYLIFLHIKDLKTFPNYILPPKAFLAAAFLDDAFPAVLVAFLAVLVAFHAVLVAVKAVQ